VKWKPFVTRADAGMIDSVPAANTLRSEFSPNGPPNIPEFGTIQQDRLTLAGRGQPCAAKPNGWTGVLDRRRVAEV
jgi:hypothetical protein